MSNHTYPRWEHLLKAGGIAILSSVGLLTYMLVLTVISTNRKHFHNCFYPYLVTLGCFDCVMLCIWLFYSVPSTLFQNYLVSEPFDAYVGALANFSYFGGLMTVFSISVNRYWGVCRNASYPRVFNKRTLTANIAFIWVIASASGVVNAMPCCHVRYYYDLSVWSYDVELWGFEYFVWWEHIAMAVTGGSILVTYGAIAWQLHKNNKFLAQNQMIDVRRQRYNIAKEVRLAGSFFTYGVYVLIESPLFTILPSVTEERWLLYAGTGLSYVILCGINPFLYLITNRSLRKTVIQALQGTAGLESQSRLKTAKFSSRRGASSTPNSRRPTVRTINVPEFRSAEHVGTSRRTKVTFKISANLEIQELKEEKNKYLSKITHTDVITARRL